MSFRDLLSKACGSRVDVFIGHGHVDNDGNPCLSERLVDRSWTSGVDCQTELYIRVALTDFGMAPFAARPNSYVIYLSLNHTDYSSDTQAGVRVKTRERMRPIQGSKIDAYAWRVVLIDTKMNQRSFSTKAEDNSRLTLIAPLIIHRDSQL